MMRSLFSGVAGLRTHQTKMDVLGNNIANVNTTSYKNMSITFSDLMYQNTQRASAATARVGGTNARQIGLGARSGAIATAIDQPGSTQTTNNPFDMQITGSAFYVVSNGQSNLYTRDGSFYIDGAGNLAMQSTGYFVLGWKAVEQEDGSYRVDTNGGLSKLQIMSAANQTYPPEGTTEAIVTGNIDANDVNVLSDIGKSCDLEFYDNLGYLYTAKFSIRDATDASGRTIEHEYSYTLSDVLDSNGNSIGADKLAAIDFSDDTSKIVVDNYIMDKSDSSKLIYTPIGSDTGISIPYSGTLDSLDATQIDLLGLTEKADVLQKKLGTDYDKVEFTLASDGKSVTLDTKEYPKVGSVKSDVTVAQVTQSTVTFTGSGTNFPYRNISRTGYLSDLMSNSSTRQFIADVYGDRDGSVGTKLADLIGDQDYEKLTYRILADGTLVVQNNSVNLTFNEKTGKLDSPQGKITLNFNENYDPTLVNEPGKTAWKGKESMDIWNKKLLMSGFTDIDIDFTNVTNVNTNGTSTVGAVKGDIENLKTGRSVGEMNGVTISKDGKINATYSNGQTKLLGQIATAEFANASGLEKQGDNLYAETLNSGRATIQDVTLDGGYITTGVLEMSNVDLSNEFTNMITTQRGFQANSRIITVSDTLLEELTNLKR
ncbi:MAG: flagellar hook-basal body complex protein [Butyrivibrio sp.]|nr:flagellar hook-basal body complex protein [Butyrivibrio sp.]